jgi:hypothetical protein
MHLNRRVVRVRMVLTRTSRADQLQKLAAQREKFNRKFDESTAQAQMDFPFGWLRRAVVHWAR